MVIMILEEISREWGEKVTAAQQLLSLGPLQSYVKRRMVHFTHYTHSMCVIYIFIINTSTS